VAPGRSIAILVEVAARNQLLRSRGHHAARALADRLEQTLRATAAAGRPDDDDEDEETAP
jgi:serine kinase of HPr protein (carbohydrate metabolism regulator)